MKKVRLAVVTVVLAVMAFSFASCDDDNYEPDRRGGNGNGRPSQPAPPGCHWEWDDGRWELDCD